MPDLWEGYQLQSAPGARVTVTEDGQEIIFLYTLYGRRYNKYCYDSGNNDNSDRAGRYNNSNSTGATATTGTTGTAGTGTTGTTGTTDTAGTGTTDTTGTQIQPGQQMKELARMKAHNDDSG